MPRVSAGADASGGACLTGAIEAGVDFGGGSLAMAGDHDAFLVRLAP